MLNLEKLPTVSIIIPTLNSQRTLAKCLQSIKKQKYRGEYEVIIADGGSNDKTLQITKEFKYKIVRNKLRTAEAGKAAGAEAAKNQILAFIDSDNILPTDHWIERLIQPFLDNKEIIATEPLFFTYDKNTHWLTRYFALLGMGDPLSLFIGNYDRYSYITNKWTEMKITTKNKKKYIILTLENKFPTIGANGFVIRREALKNYPIKNYLFDIDILKFLGRDKPIKVAKVKIGILHLFTGDISTFIRKQRRRIRDYIYFRHVGIRAEDIEKRDLIIGVFKFSISTIIILPLIVQAIQGYNNKNDIVWFFHPIACWITFLVYGYEFVISIFSKNEFNRKDWSQ